MTAEPVTSPPLSSHTLEAPSDPRFDGRLLALAVAAFLINAGSWGLLFWKLPPTDGTVFLHYNVFYGIDLVGGWRELLWMPGSGLAIFAVNTVIVLLSRQQLDRFLKTVVMMMTVVFEIMITYATFLIILLNANYAT
jgi:hypothetical protein